jgi:hypothetical protein
VYVSGLCRFSLLAYLFEAGGDLKWVLCNRVTVSFALFLGTCSNEQ